MMRSVLLASYQSYMVDAFRSALRKQNPETLCFDFSISPENELSYDRVYEVALKEIIARPLASQTLKYPELLKVAVEMMDRNEPVRKGLSADSRLIIVSKVFHFWKRFIKIKSVDLVFFEEEPHQFFDYALYLAALELGVETAWFERTLPQSGLLLKRRGSYLSIKTNETPKNFISLSGYAEKMKCDYAQVASLMYFDANDTLARMNK